MIDLSMSVEQLPEDVPFTDLPLVAQALVRRNILLRQKLHETETALRAAQEQIAALKTGQEKTTASSGG